MSRPPQPISADGAAIGVTAVAASAFSRARLGRGSLHELARCAVDCGIRGLPEFFHGPNADQYEQRWKIVEDHTMTDHPFSFVHPGFSEVGDHHIRVRAEEAPPISTERIALVSHQGVRGPLMQAGDWIVRVQVPGFDVLDSLEAQFPGNFCWFGAETFDLAHDGMLGAFLWIAELKGLTSYHDVYCQSEQVAADVTPLLRALSYNFRGFRLTKIVGRISLDPLQAHSLVDLTGRYSEPTLVKVLPADAIAASAIAPKSSDYVSPTWGEYIRTKMNSKRSDFSEDY